MPSIVVIVFVVSLTIHFVNTVGATTINTLLWNLYSRLPTPTSKAATEQRKLQSDYLKLRRELNGTSSQDEFAKWAKIRRQHDKVLEQLEKSKSSLASTRTKFDSTVSILRWISTNGLRMLLQFWCAKQPMFWLPQGWVPYYAEWLISFPRAPLGSVSIQAWQLACTSVIVLVSDAIVAVIGLVMGAGTAAASTSRTKEEPMKVSGEKAGPTPGQSAGRSKEL